MTALISIAPSWPEESFGEESIELVGYLLIALCVGGRTWCALYIGGRKKRELVDIGPYSLSRNPLYVFSVIGALGIGMVSSSLVLGGVLAASTFLILDAVVRREEGYLVEQFGDRYRRYRRRTPRWLSTNMAWSDTDHLEIRPKLVLTTFRDASLMLLALPAIEGIEALHALGHLPVLLYLP